ncbi:MAG: RodZ domain-containing protein [bacterium]
MSLGEILQAKREEKEISLEEAARETHINQKHLKALENEAYDLIPGETYLYGFLRKYCAFLGLDPEEMNRLLKEEISSHPHVTKKAVPLPRQREADAVSSGGRKDVLFGFSILVLGAILWFSLAQFMEGEKDITPATQSVETERDIFQKKPLSEESLAPEESTDTPEFLTFTSTELIDTRETSTALEAQAVEEKQIADRQDYNPKMLVLEAEILKEVWVLVSLDGEEEEETLTPGQTVRWEAFDRIEITVGDAGNLILRWNGRVLPPLGKKGEVINRVFTRKEVRSRM